MYVVYVLCIEGRCCKARPLQGLVRSPQVQRKQARISHELSTMIREREREKKNA